jgi:energy-coupling factor transporter ATP-binding protein EcfA2
VLDRLRLHRYKGFEEFVITFGEKNFLVGPNNAGKSTIVTALRLCAALASHGGRRRADEVFLHDERAVYGHLLTSINVRDSPGFVAENIRHEFREEVATVELKYKSGAVLRVVWPVDESAFFYVDRLPGMIARTPRAVLESTSAIGIVPMLSPLEQSEVVLSRDYVQENRNGRLASRHFRNHLYHLRSDSPERYEELLKFFLSHTQEISGLRLATDIGEKGLELDLFFIESATRTEKELFWAGDGMQVWLQLLYHIFRQPSVPTLVLDEPDVFLHPDLQRRLVVLLEDLGQQIILATHAPEMLAEASRSSVVWVDRVRRHASRPKDDRNLARLNRQLGSGFNLGVARALRSKLALFVEGDDMKVLRNLARVAGAMNVRAERGIAVIPLGGFTNWHHVEPFAWMARGLLGEAVPIRVVLDRDYRSDGAVHDVMKALENAGVKAHIWQRKELESYVLVPSLIARLSGVSEDEASALLAECVEAQKYVVQANFLNERQLEEVSARRHAVTVATAALPEFEAAWSSERGRLFMAPPKEVLHTLNDRLVDAGGTAVSVRALSSRMRSDELDGEMRDVLLAIEGELL